MIANSEPVLGECFPFRRRGDAPFALLSRLVTDHFLISVRIRLHSTESDTNVIDGKPAVVGEVARSEAKRMAPDCEITRHRTGLPVGQTPRLDVMAGCGVGV